MTAWSKVFRRDFLAGLGVSFGSAGPAPHEDVPVTALALLTAQRIGVLDRVCYRYRQARRGSYLAAPSDANFNIFGSYQQVFNYLAERTELHAPVTPRPFTRRCSSGPSGTTPRCFRWCPDVAAGSSSTGCPPISGAGVPTGSVSLPARAA